MSEKIFDLSEVEQNDTATIKLVHPSTGDELDACVIVYGQDSDVFRSESRKLQHKMAQYAQRNRGKSMPPEDFERLDKQKVVACVKEIKGLAYKGQPMTDAAEVFTKFPWVHEQVVQGIMDRGNFIKG